MEVKTHNFVPLQGSCSGLPLSVAYLTFQMNWKFIDFWGIMCLKNILLGYVKCRTLHVKLA
jgi:ABC-type maltose transport system permease subunit